MGATPPRRFPAPGLGAGVTDTARCSPGVLVGAPAPVVDVDVLADDRAAGVAGVERAAGAERVRLHVHVAAAAGSRCGSTATSSAGWPGGQVQAGRGDPVPLDAAPRRPVGGGEPGPRSAGRAHRRPGERAARPPAWLGARARRRPARAARTPPRRARRASASSAFMRAPRAWIAYSYTSQHLAIYSYCLC